MSFTRFFDDPAACALPETGGKGANLAKLTQRGFSVPGGFVVTASAYRLFIEAADDVFAPFADIAEMDRAALATLCETTRARLAELPIPDALQSTIHDSMALLGDPSLRVSVRSSSTLEDLEAAAFAGQHDTFLNVAPVSVVERVRQCYLSLWHHRAVAYRHQQGFDVREASMAVVVQRMVQSHSSGVAFSINPVSGKVGEITVDANFGLGESVVGGEVSVDFYRIAKGDLSVLERRIGLKEMKVVSTAEGVVHEPIADGEQVECLTPDQLTAVARLALQVEKSYDFPHDIEWAVDEAGKLLLLQARPITTFPPHWTRDESAERFPNAMTPLAWEFADEGFHRSLRTSLELMQAPPFPGKWFAIFDNYIYGNQNAVEMVLGGRALRFGSLDGLRALIPEITERFGWAMELPARWMRDLDRYLLGVGRLLAEDVSSLDAAGCWDRLLRIDALGQSYFEPNIAISMTHGLLHKLLFDALCLLFPVPEARDRYDAMTRYCETKTSLINKEIYELFRLATADPSLVEVLRGNEAKALWTSGALRADFPAFTTVFDTFISDHGHRETDPDPYEPFWADAPWVVLNAVNVLLQQDNVDDPFAKELQTKSDQHQAELDLFEHVPEDLRFFFAEVVRLARVYSSLDDVEHYQTSRLQLLFRQTLTVLGERLAAEGVLPDADSVFFTKRAQLDAWFTDSNQEATLLAESALANRAEWAKNQEREPVWDLSAPEGDDADIGDGDYSGIPGSPGSAEGEVFVVTSVNQFPEFPQGAVLVARTTNPSWTPLFYSASAVITEAGGPLSHGAVTAREMGIPAVMAMRSATSRLETGTRVKVDGSRGQVTVLPPQSESH